MRYRWSFIFLLVTLNLSVWFGVWWETPSRYLEVAFLDVGQGDAILITAPNRNQVLIDGGPDRSVIRALGEVMPFYDRSIDLVLTSHPDQDHIGGLLEVFDRYDIAGFIEPAFEAGTAVYQNLEELVQEEQSSHLIAQAGTRITLGSGVTLDVIEAKPATWGPRGGKPDTNYSSIVAKLTYASTSFLFMGDASLKLENQLLYKDSGELKADVLKVAHHGAKSSNSLAFFKAVNPDLAIISVNAKNRYNHPRPEVLAWLEQLNIETLQTKDLGTIKLKSDGVSIGF
ncbi:MAG TPA: MBL fold metallo-hydrolase [Candidatus Paceibacterota bacterium]|nr:MBL fold metallo-hydrolase [Candidatus Paceibacterota bacterium]